MRHTASWRVVLLALVGLLSVGCVPVVVGGGPPLEGVVGGPRTLHIPPGH